MRAVEVLSAPRADAGRSSARALARSLDEIAGWEWSGAVVAVEHCDATRPGRPGEKGFLDLADELRALDGLDPAAVGVAVNWGRSAIEGRSATTPVEHVARAREAGRLLGVMFSGAAPVEGWWGRAWQDAHVPPRGPQEALAPCAASLLGSDEVAATLAAAGPLRFPGVKVAAPSSARTVAERLAVARAALEVVTGSRSSAAGRA